METDKDGNEYFVKNAICGGYFHGETWYRCPYCDTAFEYFDAVYESKGILSKGCNNYICGKCKKVFHIS